MLFFWHKSESTAEKSTSNDWSTNMKKRSEDPKLLHTQVSI